MGDPVVECSSITRVARVRFPIDAQGYSWVLETRVETEQNLFGGPVYVVMGAYNTTAPTTASGFAGSRRYTMQERMIDQPYPFASARNVENEEKHCNSGVG